MAGRFIWYELITSDTEAAEAFYTKVIGWAAADSGLPDVHYTIFSSGERPAAGVMAIPEEALQSGGRPAWIGYIGVADVDAATARLTQAGGHVHRPPDDIPNVGRFAVVADPAGAIFALFTPSGDEASTPAAPEAPGTFGWHELYSAQGEEAAFAFYSGLFGWETSELMDMGPMGKYRIFGADGVQLGGMMNKPADMPVSAWGYYINVDAIDAAMERISANGGNVLMAPHEVPGGSWIVQATDPQGAHFALVAPKR